MTALQFHSRKNFQVRNDFAWAFCAASCSLLLIAPFFAFIFTSFVLINSKSYPKEIRYFLILIMIIAMSMMTGARPLSSDDSNDIDGYYHVYQMLAQGDINYLTHYGGGIETGTGGLEVGLPLLLFFFSLFLPPLSINGLMFCLAFSSSFLLLIWIEKNFYRKKHPPSPAFIGTCFLLLNLYFSTQLTRQFFSLIILLYAFSARGWLRQLIYVSLASFFHLTAIPFYILYRLLRKGFIGCTFVIVFMFSFRIFFQQITAAFDLLPPVIIEKLTYYIGNEDEYSPSDITSIRIIMLLCSISLLVLITTRFNPRNEAKAWLAIPWVAAAIHIILLPIPLASLRTTLIIHSIVPGLITYMMFKHGGPKIQNLLILVINFLLFYKIIGFLSAVNSGNLLPTIQMLIQFSS